ATALFRAERLGERFTRTVAFHLGGERQPERSLVGSLFGQLLERVKERQRDHKREEDGAAEPERDGEQVQDAEEHGATLVVKDRRPPVIERGPGVMATCRPGRSL